MKDKFVKKKFFIHTTNYEAHVNSTYPKMLIRNQRGKRRGRAKRRISFCRRTLFTSACEFALKGGGVTGNTSGLSEEALT